MFSLLIRKINQLVKFRSDSKVFNKFINNNFNNFNNFNNLNKKTLCVVVCPWHSQPVPWFSITLSLLLYEKKRYNITIMLDDLNIGKSGFLFYIQIMYIEKILKQITPYVKYIKLSSYKVEAQALNCNFIEKLISLNSLHYARGERSNVARREYENIIRPQFSIIYSALIECFDTLKIDRIIVPGGIWGSSGIIQHCANERGIQSMSYDSGDGRMLLSTSGVAAQLTDIPMAFKEVLLSVESKKIAIKYGKEKLELRMKGDDSIAFFNSSLVGKKINGKYYLMLLNLVWDSAALGLHAVYGGMLDWIIDTVKWVLKNTDKVIVIRQHPVERNNYVRVSDNYSSELNRVFGSNSRIIFISAKDNVDTYELIKKSDCILGFSSTSIVEAVALGVPAIIVSSAYYKDLGIVYSATSKNEYYNYLLKANDNKLIVTINMKENAYICNYLTQTCNWIETLFTPFRSNFLKWSKAKLQPLIKDNLMVESIVTCTPHSLLKHRAIMNDRFGK